jgi:general nucleoside transport system permease protein
MSDVAVTPTIDEASRTKRVLLPSSPMAKAFIIGGAVMLLLSIVRVISGADDLTSSGTFGAALRLGAPIALVGLGALYSERAGVLNIGLDGVMVLGTFFAGWMGSQFHPWVGVLAAIGGGLLGGVLHALLTIYLRIDQVMAGVVMIILAPGVTRFMGQALWEGRTDAAATLSPPIEEGEIGRFTFPFLAGGRIGSWRSPDMLGWVEDKEWFFVSDLAGLGRGLTVNLSILVVIALALLPLSWMLLFRTSFGLRLRSVGESPSAADSLGVNVYRHRVIAVLMSGGLAGLAGAVLVSTGTGQYREGQVAGRGFIGIAAMIFGNWRPGGLATGAGLFGYADALQLRDNAAVRALFLFVALLLVLVAGWLLWRQRWIPAVGALVVAALSGTYYLITDEVPSQFVTMTPYAVTLVVLIFAAQRLRPPRAAGIPWSKG